VKELEEERSRVTVTLKSGARFSAAVVVGADGASSSVAHLSGLRRRWSQSQYAVCANEDIPCDPELLQERYGPRVLLSVVLAYGRIGGYGWLFPKREHLCVGIGGRLRRNADIQRRYEAFFEALRAKNLLPGDLRPIPGNVRFAIDPAGAINRSPRVTKGRIILIGDAAGFVSGSTGEGIYPAMVSAQCAARVIDNALRGPSTVSRISEFESSWRSELGRYIKDLPGGTDLKRAIHKADLLFKNRLFCRVAARSFLYGQAINLRTLASSLWR